MVANFYGCFIVHLLLPEMATFEGVLISPVSKNVYTFVHYFG